MLDLNEYKSWLQANHIRKKALAEQIGYRYDHLTQVLAGKKPLSLPLQKMLQLFRQNKEYEKKYIPQRPDIQPLRREPGFYWVRYADNWMVAEYDTLGLWQVTHNICYYVDSDWSEIDETRLQK